MQMCTACPSNAYVIHCVYKRHCVTIRDDDILLLPVSSVCLFVYMAVSSTYLQSLYNIENRLELNDE